MTVAQIVITNAYRQSPVHPVTALRSAEQLKEQQRFHPRLEREGKLTLRLEFLPPTRLPSVYGGGQADLSRSCRCWWPTARWY